MKKIGYVAIVAAMFMMGMASSAQVVSSEEQLLGNWRVTMNEEQSMLLVLEKENAGNMAFSISDDEIEGVILVAMDCRWVFSNDILAFLPNTETVKVQYFGEDATMKSLFSQFTEEQRQELASALAGESLDILRLQFLREENGAYIVTKPEAEDNDEGDDNEEGEDDNDDDGEEEPKEFLMTRVAKKVVGN